MIMQWQNMKAVTMQAGGLHLTRRSERRCDESGYFYIILLFFVITACNHKKHNSGIKNTSLVDNDSILVTYFCGPVETNAAIRCKTLAAIQEQHPENPYSCLIPNELIDNYMEDGSVLDGMKLEQVPVDLIDTFIVDNTVINKIIKLLDNRKKAADFSEDARMYVTIKRNNGENDCLCFDHFPNRVKYNDISYLTDKELSFLLRYYSGYYSWFAKSDLDRLEELRDTVFYQKVLEQINLCGK